MADLKGPALTQKNLPQGQQPQSEVPVPVPEVEVGTERIVAKPLSSPEFLDLQPSNPNVKLYWANRLYENGHRVDFRIAQGFEIAKPEDVKNLPPSLARDGKIYYGDLVLMKISKAIYFGALLNNHNKAIKRLHKRGIQQRGEAMLEEELVNTPGKVSDKRKIVVYSPADPHEIQQAVREGRL